MTGGHIARALNRIRLFRGRQRVVVGEFHLFPFSVDDFLANFRSGFALLRFSVREGCFLFAEDAMGSVKISKTIQQALVPHFFVAAAVAWLLIENRFHFGRQREDVASLRVCKLRGIECVRERIFGWLGVVGRHGDFHEFRSRIRCSWRIRRGGNLRMQRTCAKRSQRNSANDSQYPCSTKHCTSRRKSGGVGKRLTPAVLKTVRPERVSWVRIPPPPPSSLGVQPGDMGY